MGSLQKVVVTQVPSAKPTKNTDHCTPDSRYIFLLLVWFLLLFVVCFFQKKAFPSFASHLLSPPFPLLSSSPLDESEISCADGDGDDGVGGGDDDETIGLDEEYDG